MSNTIVAWVIANKEWSLASLCTVSGGIFAFLKWKWPPAKDREKSKSSRDGSIAATGSVHTLTAIGTGATVTGGVISGSHNMQNVVINHSLHPAEIPIRERRPSTPTASEIRQRQNSALKGIPLVMQREVLEKYRNSFLNLLVAWPIKICGVYPERSGEIITVDAQCGEESWGNRVRFDVRGTDFPILNTLEEGHNAFIRGRIRGISEFLIEIEVTTLEFE